MKLRFAWLIAAIAFVLPASASELNFTPFHWNGVYAAGERAGWRVQADASVPPGTTYSYVVRSEGSVEIARGTIDPSKGPSEIAVTLNRPGTIYVTVDRDPPPGRLAPAEAAEVNAALQALISRNDPAMQAIFSAHPGLCLLGQPCAAPPAPAWLPPIQAHLAVLGAAFDPGRIAPSAPRPADFDAFWAAKLAELARVPMHPVLTEIAAPLPGIKFYRVRLDSWNSHVQGYLAVPARPGRFAAMIQYQWAGVYALIPWNCANRAAEGWLCFNVSSHDMAPDQASGVPTNYPEIGNTSRDTSYFLAMYLRDTRALDWVRTLAQWNRRTLVVTGTSMGGHQSLVTAGLNPGKVTAVVVNEPSGGDVLAALDGRMAAYPNWPVNNPAVAETARYFDTANFASRITAPTLAAVGLIDSVCPPASVLSAVNRIAAPVEIIAMPESDHNNYTPDKQGAFLQRQEEVFATLLHGGRLVPDQTIARGR